MRSVLVFFGVACLVITALLLANNSASSIVTAGPIATDTPTATTTGTQTATATATFTFVPTTAPPCFVLTKAPKLLQPVNNSKTTQQKVALTWKKTSCKPKYAVEIRRDSSTGTIVQTKGNVKKLSFTTKTLVRGIVYFWRVSACNDNGCVPSGFRKFTVIIPPTPKPTATKAPTKTPTPNAQPTATKTPSGNCSPSYPTVCIPPPPPDLNCDDIPYTDFTVLEPDPHHFDGDNDGVGCES